MEELVEAHGCSPCTKQKLNEQNMRNLAFAVPSCPGFPPTLVHSTMPCKEGVRYVNPLFQHHRISIRPWHLCYKIVCMHTCICLKLNVDLFS